MNTLSTAQYFEYKSPQLDKNQSQINSTINLHIHVISLNKHIRNWVN